MKRNLVTVSNTAKHINTSENKPRTRALGRSGLSVSPIGAGTWQWGGRFYWGYGRMYNDADLAEAYSTCVANGINWFDTAELYGRGRSERILGSWSTGVSENLESIPVHRNLSSPQSFFRIRGGFTGHHFGVR